MALKLHLAYFPTLKQSTKTQRNPATKNRRRSWFQLTCLKIAANQSQNMHTDTQTQNQIDEHTHTHAHTDSMQGRHRTDTNNTRRNRQRHTSTQTNKPDTQTQTQRKHTHAHTHIIQVTQKQNHTTFTPARTDKFIFFSSVHKAMKLFND
jgi:hypothetical protein